MKQVLKTIITTIAVILVPFSQSSYAAVTASVSVNQVAKGEIFTLKIVSDNRANSDEIDFSILESDFYLGRPSFSSSFNSINGTRSVRSEWTLSMAPLTAGNLTIPAFDVQGEKTTPINIVSTIDPTTPTSDDLVMYQTRLSKNEIYPGEIVQLDTRLIIKTDTRRIQNPQITPPYSTNELNIEPNGEANQYLRIIDGVESTVVDQSYHITTLTTGEVAVIGPKISATILNSGKNGATRLVPINTTPQHMLITVLEKPADFVGAWLPSPNLELSQNWLDENGEDIVSSLEINTVAGSAITREITLTVEGIAQSQLPNITVNYPNEVRYYDEPPKIVQEGNSVSMTLKHVLIPKTVGEIDLPAITINWWDTVNKKSKSETISGLKLLVDKSEIPSIELTSNAPIENKPSTVVTETVVVTEAGFWPYLTALFALFWIVTLGLLLKNRHSNTQANTIEEKNSDNFNKLIESIKNHDGMSSQANLKLWYADNPLLSPDIKADIDKKIESMIASLYSESATSWEMDDLIAAISQANKRKSNKTKDDDALATL